MGTNRPLGGVRVAAGHDVVEGAIGEYEDLMLGHATEKSTSSLSSPPSRRAAGP